MLLYNREYQDLKVSMQICMFPGLYAHRYSRFLGSSKVPRSSGPQNTQVLKCTLVQAYRCVSLHVSMFLPKSPSTQVFRVAKFLYLFRVHRCTGFQFPSPQGASIRKLLNYNKLPLRFRSQNWAYQKADPNILSPKWTSEGFSDLNPSSSASDLILPPHGRIAHYFSLLIEFIFEQYQINLALLGSV